MFMRSRFPARATLAILLLLFAAPLVALLRGDLQHAEPSAGLARSASFSPDDISALRCSNRNSSGVGLKGDYFSQQTLQGELLLSRVDSTVEFEPSREWPVDRGANRPRSARWQGWVKAPLSGRYRFHGEPSAHITVGGLPMAGRAAAPDAFLEMTAGTFYPIQMEVDSLSTTRVRLEWTAPHGMRYVIPRALLFLPTPTVAGAAS